MFEGFIYLILFFGPLFGIILLGMLPVLLVTGILSLLFHWVKNIKYQILIATINATIGFFLITVVSAGLILFIETPDILLLAVGMIYASVIIISGILIRYYVPNFKLWPDLITCSLIIILLLLLISIISMILSGISLMINPSPSSLIDPLEVLGYIFPISRKDNVVYLFMGASIVMKIGIMVLLSVTGYWIIMKWRVSWLNRDENSGGGNPSMMS